MDYNSMTVPKLRAECKTQMLVGYSKMRRAQLIAALEAEQIRLGGKGAPNREPEVKVKGRSLGATTMGVETPRYNLNVEVPFVPITDQQVDDTIGWLGDEPKRTAARKARNKAKARRRRVRSAGCPAGF